MPAKLFQKIGEASGCGEILKRAEDSKFIYKKSVICHHLRNLRQEEKKERSKATKPLKAAKNK